MRLQDLGVIARIERTVSGDLLRAAPGAMRLVHHEGLRTVRSIAVRTNGATVSCRRARNRVDRTVASGVERRGTGDFHGATPGAASLREWHRDESAGECRGAEGAYSNHEAKATMARSITRTK
jgi:hypothetical protein